jgi:hypothetical protein
MNGFSARFHPLKGESGHSTNSFGLSIERISCSVMEHVVLTFEIQSNISLTMKKKQMIMAGLVGLMLLSNELLAQSQLIDKPAQQRAAAQTQRMTTNLKLDSVQTIKVARINLRYAQRIDPVIQGNGSRISKLKAVRTMQKEKEAELKQVLSKEQFERFKEQQQALKDEIKERRKS